jgi:hypothetical protein
MNQLNTLHFSLEAIIAVSGSTGSPEESAAHVAKFREDYKNHYVPLPDSIPVAGLHVSQFFIDPTDINDETSKEICLQACQVAADDGFPDLTFTLTLSPTTTLAVMAVTMFKQNGGGA